MFSEKLVSYCYTTWPCSPEDLNLILQYKFLNSRKEKCKIEILKLFEISLEYMFFPSVFIGLYVHLLQIQL